ncbi:protein HsdA [Sphingomonas deserti]|uniref:Protein HsdA n=2 Tax=Allosphingosinicella deserti TaxID=2116704 RepID=A0A2P7QRN3_9SPHN|nr:protein HsdA [Sphingomonas deserti]
MKADTYVDSGIPVIRGTNIGRSRNLKGDWVYITEDLAATMPNCLLQEGDLVFPHRGSIGEVGLIDGAHVPIFLSSSMMKFRPDPCKLLSRYAYYYFRSEQGKQEILRFASSVGTPGIGQPLASMRQFSIPLPDLCEQASIADVISSLDDKIELNRRMNETLEGMAQAIFQEWFVDFGPTRRKAAGEANPQAVMGGLTPHPVRAAELAGIFPSAFGDDGLPLGWNETPIGDLVNLAGGSTPSTVDESLWSPGVHHWATPKDLSGLDDFALFNTGRKISDAGLAKITSGLLPVGSVLLSSRAPIGYLAIAQVEVAINQGFIGLEPTQNIGSGFLYCWCKANMPTIVANANGSTFQEISKRNFRPITSPMPDNRVAISAFGNVVEPLFARIVTAAAESRALAETRDYLLPRLMSGGLSVAPVNSERL